MNLSLNVHFKTSQMWVVKVFSLSVECSSAGHLEAVKGSPVLCWWRPDWAPHSISIELLRCDDPDGKSHQSTESHPFPWAGGAVTASWACPAAPDSPSLCAQ